MIGYAKTSFAAEDGEDNLIASISVGLQSTRAARTPAIDSSASSLEVGDELRSRAGELSSSSGVAMRALL